MEQRPARPSIVHRCADRDTERKGANETGRESGRFSSRHL
jgi:hypothetical protein